MAFFVIPEANVTKLYHIEAEVKSITTRFSLLKHLQTDV